MQNNDFDNYSEVFFDELHTGHNFDEVAKGFAMYYHDCLPEDKNAPILDVGCGAGHFLRFLELEGYKKTEGIEISKQQATITKNHVNSTIHEGDVAVLLEKQSIKYEMITLNDVLEHIPKQDSVSFLQTLKNGLTDTGSLAINVPQVAGLTTSYNRYNDFTHQLIFTQMSLQQVLRMAGFKQIRFVEEKWPFKLTFRHIMYRSIRWFWYKFLTIAYFIEMPGESRPSSWQVRLVAIAKK